MFTYMRDLYMLTGLQLTLKHPFILHFILVNSQAPQSFLLEQAYWQLTLSAISNCQLTFQSGKDLKSFLKQRFP